MDTKLRYTHGFKRHRTVMAEGLTQSLAIVEHLNELEFRCLRLLTLAEVLPWLSVGECPFP